MFPGGHQYQQYAGRLRPQQNGCFLGIKIVAYGAVFDPVTNGLRDNPQDASAEFLTFLFVLAVAAGIQPLRVEIHHRFVIIPVSLVKFDVCAPDGRRLLDTGFIRVHRPPEHAVQQFVAPNEDGGVQVLLVLEIQVQRRF